MARAGGKKRIDPYDGVTSVICGMLGEVSAHQRKCIYWLLRGYPRRDIAAKIHLGDESVKTILQETYKRLGYVQGDGGAKAVAALALRIAFDLGREQSRKRV